MVLSVPGRTEKGSKRERESKLLTELCKVRLNQMHSNSSNNNGILSPYSCCYLEFYPLFHVGLELHSLLQEYKMPSIRGDVKEVWKKGYIALRCRIDPTRNSKIQRKFKEF